MKGGEMMGRMAASRRAPCPGMSVRVRAKAKRKPTGHAPDRGETAMRRLFQRACRMNQFPASRNSRSETAPSGTKPTRKTRASG